MKFNYSICYPDQEETKYFKNEVSEIEIRNIYRSFPWNKELRKENKFYSPSIEINRLTDNTKLIISGLGKGKLANHMVMLFIDKNGMVTNEFDQKQYRKAMVLESQMTISKTEELLDQFITSAPPKAMERYFNKPNEVFIDDTLGPLETWIARIGGPFLAIICFYALIILIRDNMGIWPIVIVGGLMLVFLIGSIRFENKLRSKNSS